ncbi:low choriolytic enzyme-like isoform X2 [Protopterus annectens]|uniref:low choriolytic enzyme-like isoform X2 n=1 Tax=Protopterus annectens TaxID=7888 RepID=UPI001CFABFB8|nr:low choriolytic enzyme-like isoform X2 [Protopterus annectens]
MLAVICEKLSLSFGKRINLALQATFPESNQISDDDDDDMKRNTGREPDAPTQILQINNEMDDDDDDVKRNTGREPDAPTQILQINNEMVNRLPLEFGDIIKHPLGNADRCTSASCKWPASKNGKVVVPYVIASEFTREEQAIIKRAMREFSQKTCIVFSPRKSQRDYISIQSLGGCFSYIGRVGGEQPVSLQRHGCVYTGTVQHELLHALGFHHEQNRSDRDNYVDIIFGNIIRGLEYNFRKVDTNNLETEYDYYSVMHYGRTAFSKNGEATIIPKPDPNVPIGKAYRFSSGDIYRVNKLYCNSAVYEDNNMEPEESDAGIFQVMEE